MAHSAQREIRERHHYSVDCVVAIYVGILLWKMTGFIWSNKRKSKQTVRLEKIQNRLIHAAKDSDMETVRRLVEEMEVSLGEEKQSGVVSKRAIDSVCVCHSDHNTWYSYSGFDSDKRRLKIWILNSLLHGYHPFSISTYIFLPSLFF